MEKVRKLYAAALVILLILFTFGCGIQKDTEIQTEIAENAGADTADIVLPPYEGATDPITFHFFVRDPGVAATPDNPVLQKLTEITGVTVEIEYLVGSLDQKINQMIAEENYPDVIFAEPGKLIDAGVFIPLEDKLKEHSYLYDFYDAHYEKLRSADGHIYILDMYSVWEYDSLAIVQLESGFYLQKAVLEEAGYPIPKTLHEYFALIEDYQKRHPTINGYETIGFELLCDGWRDFALRNPPQHLLGGGNDGDAYVDPDTLQAVYYQNTETAKKYYRKLNESYHKGLIRADSLTQNYAQYIDKIATGAVLGFFDQSWNFEQAESVLIQREEYERTYVALPITEEGVEDGYLSAKDNNISGNNGIGITKKCEDPDRLLEFLDYLIRPEVQDYLQWGVEGIDYEVLENGDKIFTEEGRDKFTDPLRKRNETGHYLWYYTPKRQGLYEDGSPCGPDDSTAEFRAALSDYDRTFLDAYGFTYPVEFLNPPVMRNEYYPVWAMSFETGGPAKMAQARLAELCDSYYARLILCPEDEFDSLWEEFLQAFEDADLEAYLNAVNDRIQTINGIDRSE